MIFFLTWSLTWYNSEYVSPKGFSSPPLWSHKVLSLSSIFLVENVVVCCFLLAIWKIKVLECVLLFCFEKSCYMQLNSDSFQMTYMHIVPPLALFLAKQPQVDNFDLKTLKTLVSAAAPLGGKLTEEVEQRLDVDFLQGRSCFWLLRLLLSSFF